MSKAGSAKKKMRWVLLPDYDKLGLLVAGTLATIVLIVNLFYQQVFFLEVLFRVGLTFVVAWCLTAFAVRYVLRATIAEIAAQRRLDRERRRREREAAEAAEEDGSAENAGEV